jgi:hypothetical protein
MLSRALSLAAVMLLIGGFAAEQTGAQAQNLEAGKSPSQIFAGTCSACHKSPRGLLKTVPPGSLSSFLRQHYTTSPDMANVLSTYLASNGANDTRYGVNQKGGKESQKDGAKETRSEPKPDSKPDARSDARPDQPERFGRRQRSSSVNEEAGKPESEPRQTTRPDADGAQQGEAGRHGEGGRHGRNSRRMARPAEAPAEASPDADGQVPARAAERRTDSRRNSAKQKLGKGGKPGGGDATVRDRDKDPFREFFREREKSEPPKDEPASVQPPASTPAKEESGMPDAARPASDSPPQAVKVEAPNETSTLRTDSAPPAGSTPAPAAVSGSGSDPGSTQSAAGSAPPAMAVAPPPAPAAPAGPPTPPVSQ